MKTLISVVFLTVISLQSCKHCGHGSHDDATKYFSESGFTEVEAGGSFDVQIVQGESYEIEVKADDKVLSHVDMKRRGEKLIIKLDGVRFRHCDHDTKVKITMPNLKGIKSSGGSYFYCEETLNGDGLKIDASGGSQVDLKLNYSSVNIEGSGGSKVDLDGSCSDLDINMSGGSKLQLFDLYTSTCDVDGSGGSKAEVSVSNDLSVDLSGGCKVVYNGSPSLHSKTSGGSSVERK